MNVGSKLSVGNSLNEVFALYQQNFGVLIPAAFWLFLPVSILGGIVGNKDVGLLALVAVLTFAVAMLYQGMVVSLVRDVQVETKNSSVGELLSSVGPVLPTLLVTAIIYGIGVGVGFLLFVVPGCILLTIWAVIAPVIVVERSGVMGSFGRSRELVRGNGWPVFGVLIVAFLIAIVGNLALNAIGASIANGALVRIVFTAIASTFAAPISALVAAVLYFRLVAMAPTEPCASIGSPEKGGGPNFESHA
jgi:hypothetical protein